MTQFANIVQYKLFHLTARAISPSPQDFTERKTHD
jgi:hypothetical protein